MGKVIGESYGVGVEWNGGQAGTPDGQSLQGAAGETLKKNEYEEFIQRKNDMERIQALTCRQPTSQGKSEQAHIFNSLPAYSEMSHDEARRKALEKNTLGDKDARNDPTKLRMELISPEMLEALGSVLTYGATRYSARNWEKGIPHSELFGALQRHLLAYLQGNATDESGMPHLWHAFCDLGMLLMLDIRRPDLDDLHRKADA